MVIHLSKPKPQFRWKNIIAIVIKQLRMNQCRFLLKSERVSHTRHGKTNEREHMAYNFEVASSSAEVESAQIQNILIH